MSVAFYLDHNVDRAVAEGLRLRGVDVLTALEDGTTTLADPDLLDRASALGRVIVTHDQDFLREGPARQRTGRTFAGILYAHQLDVSLGRLIDDLELIAQAQSPEDYAGRVRYLPL